MSFTTSCINCTTRRGKVSEDNCYLETTNICRQTVGSLVIEAHSQLLLHSSLVAHSCTLNTFVCKKLLLFIRTSVPSGSLSDFFYFISASGGDITETAIELAPLDHDNSHSRKRVSCFPSIDFSLFLILFFFFGRLKRTTSVSL